MSADIRSVELEYGVEIRRYRHKNTTYWRVIMPSWAKGTWLDATNAAFQTLDDALQVLDDTGTLNALEAWWRARMEESRARQSFFSKAMNATTTIVNAGKSLDSRSDT